jgi:hypothetical protein
MERLDFDEINKAALSGLRSLLERWLPDGCADGGEWVCRNPTRNDRRAGSFKVSITKGIWADWATGDRGSDPVSLLAYIRGCRQIEAARELSEWLSVGVRSGPVPERNPEPVPDPTAFEPALNLWRSCVPIVGTIGEAYLQGRGITIDPGGSVRFSPSLPYWWRPTDAERSIKLGEYPALVLAVTYGDQRNAIAVHRIYLDPDTIDKVALPDPEEEGGTLPAKKAYGSVRGCHIPLGPPVDGDLIVTEGPENALSLMQATGLPAWSVIAAGNMPGVRLPRLPKAKSILIGADNDPAGVAAAEKAKVRYLDQGRSVRIAIPPTPGADFNDMLRENPNARVEV